MQDLLPDTFTINYNNNHSEQGAVLWYLVISIFILEKTPQTKNF
jgi:hypothetical protein